MTMIAFSDRAQCPVFFSPSPDNSPRIVGASAVLSLHYGLSMVLLRALPAHFKSGRSLSAEATGLFLLNETLSTLNDCGLLQGTVLKSEDGQPDLLLINKGTMPALAVPFASILSRTDDQVWPGSIPYTPRQLADALTTFAERSGWRKPC